MQQDYCKLLMVTSGNNNKFYEMVYTGGANFTVNYGRVESTSTSKSYPYSKWNSLKREKIAKGYKDVTELVATTVVDDPVTDTQPIIGDTVSRKVAEFLKLMQSYRDNLVRKTYSVKATQVTQHQLEAAQKLINELSVLNRLDTLTINKKLIEIYTVIPRYMGRVGDYLLPNINLDKVFEQEQDNLDAIASQVALLSKKPATQAEVTLQQSLLDMLGIEMEETEDYADIQYLLDQNFSSGYHGRSGKVHAVFSVKKTREDEAFNQWMSSQENRQTRTLIHGTRCTSVLPILEQGLKIRPTGNFQFSGKAYGDGNYFSETMAKSLGYTGYDSDKVILVYEVHVGNPFKYEGWFRGNEFALTYKNLKERGFDSTFVSAGNGLLNSEIIAYNESQCHIKKVIWLKS